MFKILSFVVYFFNFLKNYNYNVEFLNDSNPRCPNLGSHPQEDQYEFVHKISELGKDYIIILVLHISLKTYHMIKYSFLNYSLINLC